MTARRALAAVLLAVTAAVTATACDPTGSGVIYQQACPPGQHQEPIQGIQGLKQCVKDKP